MVTEEKKQTVESLHMSFNNATSAVFVSLAGVTVEGLTTLRKDLRGVDTKLKVVKNTLARRAVEKTSYEVAQHIFKGPVSVALSFSDDITSPAKAIIDFGKDNSNLKILGAVVEGAILDVKAVQMLAMTPPKPVVQAMFLGLMQAPARNFMGVMEGAARKLLYVLNAISEKK